MKSAWGGGVGYFNKPYPEITYFYSDIGLEVTFTYTAELQTPYAQLCKLI